MLTWNLSVNLWLLLLILSLGTTEKSGTILLTLASEAHQFTCLDETNCWWPAWFHPSLEDRAAGWPPSSRRRRVLGSLSCPTEGLTRAGPGQLLRTASEKQELATMEPHFAGF